MVYLKSFFETSNKQKLETEHFIFPDAFDVMSSGRAHDPIDVRDRLSPKLASIKEGEKR